MKKYYLFFISILMSLSCTKLENAINDVNQDIAGRYIITTALFRGGALDMNGDNVRNVDLLSEFTNDGNMVILKADLGALVYRIAEKDNPHSRIVIRVPLQNIYNKYDGIEVGPVMNYVDIDFDYSTDKNGNISIGNPSYSHIRYDDYENFHYREIRDARIISIQNGTIYAEITVSYYDCLLKVFLTNTLTLSYRRISDVA